MKGENMTPAQEREIAKLRRYKDSLDAANSYFAEVGDDNLADICDRRSMMIQKTIDETEKEFRRTPDQLIKRAKELIEIWSEWTDTPNTVAIVAYVRHLEKLVGGPR